MTGLPSKLNAVVMDSENVFLVRIFAEPRLTDTGLANIIPQGIDRENRDFAIKFANRIVHCYNMAEPAKEE